VRAVRATPENLDARFVVEALRHAWGFHAVTADYAAVGAGSYHWNVRDDTGRRGFVTVDDLGQKAWLGDTRDAAFDGLRSAFDTALALRESGLEFVIAPIPTRNGESVHRLGPQYAIALFPFVEGVAGEFGVYEAGDRKAILAMLAELHSSPVAAASGLRTAGLTIPGRRHLEAALLDLDESWTGGPLSERARDAVRDSASELTDLLSLADRLAAEAEERGVASVVTHGEPHAANVMRTSKGRVLVDWDTVALAPPERDLWMLVDDDQNDAALDFFRLTWDLKDLAEYLNVLRSPHTENDDTVRQYQALVRSAAIRERWTAALD
jgi:spectinomycin phosphotransferase